MTKPRKQLQLSELLLNLSLHGRSVNICLGGRRVRHGFVSRGEKSTWFLSRNAFGDDMEQFYEDDVTRLFLGDKLDLKDAIYRRPPQARGFRERRTEELFRLTALAKKVLRT